MTIEFPHALIEKLQTAVSVTVLTGAGVSAESGVPTFRDAQTGLWAKYDPQELASPYAFQQNPKLVWDWYQWRRELVADAQPNPAHHALVELENHISDFTLITQNVDGLHEQAGSQNIIELHGNITKTKCFDHDHPISQWEDDHVPPHCPQCGSLLRPDVVWFGESLPAMALYTAVNKSKTCDLFLSIGTSSVVQPAASLPVEAIQNRIPTVEINPEPTPLSPHMSYVLSGAAGEVLPQLVMQAFP